MSREECVLRNLSSFISHELLSRNAAGFVKELLVRKDTRLFHYTDRFLDKKDDLAKYLENIHILAESEASKLFNSVFSDLSLQKAKLLSRNERSASKDLPVTASLTYGEIDFNSFYKILRRLGASKDMIFVDLGSGTGRAVLEARLVMDFCECRGIEILQSLHCAAEDTVLKKFDARKSETLALTKTDDIVLTQGSIIDEDNISCSWADGDVIFANSTCFDLKLIDEISELGKKLRPGAIFITFTKPLRSTAFELLDKSRLKMSWGPATVYIQRRLGHNGKPVGPSPLDQWKHSSILQTGARALVEINECGAEITGVAPAGSLIQCIYRVQRPVKRAGDTTELKTLFRVPADSGSASSTSLPLVIFLHGASARGTSFENHSNMGLPKAINDCENDGTIPVQDRFYMLAPLCPLGVEWKTPHMSEAVLELIDHMLSKVRIDPTRVYLTGVSMGGLGAWVIGAKANQKFAAISPMCGGGSPIYAKLLRDVPIWFYHSAEDNVIGVEETESLYAALLKEGSTVAHFTRYSACSEPAAQSWMIGHNCWGRTYRDRKFWEWLLSQRAFSEHH